MKPLFYSWGLGQFVDPENPTVRPSGWGDLAGTYKYRIPHQYAGVTVKLFVIRYANHQVKNLRSAALHHCRWYNNLRPTKKDEKEIRELIDRLEAIEEFRLRKQEKRI